MTRAMCAYGMARLHWAHCEDCHQKLDYQINSILWDSIERGYKGHHRCGGCQGKHDAGEILANFRKRLKAALRRADGGKA